MKIGLYGGSFNPVQNAHIAVIKKVLEKKLVDEVWVLPCKDHAFKNNLVSIDDRIAMLKLALKDITNVKINLIELSFDGKNYTSETVKKLRKNYSHNFSFIVGTDILPEINDWHDFEYIKDTLPFIILNRKGYGLSKYNRILSELIVDEILTGFDLVSSTDVRDRVANGESISKLVPPNVEKYILDHKLYVNTIQYINPSSTVDLIVPINKGLLFVKRKNAPFKDYWAFPGGYLNCGQENLETAAIRELSEETSLKIDSKDLELLGVYSDPNRDPRGHVISHAYVVKKYEGTLMANDDAARVKVFRTKPKKLAFDHSKIYDDYKKYVQNR